MMQTLNAAWFSYDGVYMVHGVRRADAQDVTRALSLDTHTTHAELGLNT